MLGIFQGIAGATRNPELAIDQADAAKLAEATARVADQYNMTLDPKTAAWISLTTVSFGIFAPRIMVMIARKDIERAKRKEQAFAPPPPMAPTPNTNTPNGLGPQPISEFDDIDLSKIKTSYQ